jgi:hypothetical protein
MIIHKWISSDGSELVPTTDVKINLDADDHDDAGYDVVAYVANAAANVEAAAAAADVQDEVALSVAVVATVDRKVL